MKDHRQYSSNNGMLDIKVKLERAPNNHFTGNTHNRDSQVGKRARTHNRRNLMMLAGLLGVMIAGSYMMKNLFASEGGSYAYPPTKVALFEAKEYMLPHLFEGVGALAAVHEVQIAAEVMGRVSSIHFESGQFVEKGQLLFQLADAREKSERSRLEAERDFLTLQLKRYEKLVKEKAIDASKYDEALSKQIQIDASLDAINVAIAEKAIRAPFSGIVGISQIHLGDIVNIGQKLTTLVDETRFHANFTLDEKYAKFISLNQPVQIYISALNKQLFAQINAIDPLISNARLVAIQAEVHTKDIDISGLRSGMFIKAFVEGEAMNALLIPETALTYTIYGSSVLVAKRHEDGGTRVKAVRVETGRKYEGFVAITKGISIGDAVVVSGQHKLGDGSIIEAVEHDTLSIVLPESLSKSRSKPTSESIPALITLQE